MQLDVLVPSPESQSFIITVNARSFLELLGAVDDAIGDIYPLYGAEADASGSLTTSAARSGCCYFIIRNIPRLPQLIISCEETFAFLVEGYQQLWPKPSGLADSETGLKRPLLTLVARPNAAATSSLCALPTAVIATSTSVANVAAGTGGAGALICFTCPTEGINVRLPLGASYKEMWKIISDSCPRVTKGVHRLVTGPAKQAVAGGVFIDVDGEDDYSLEYPRLAVGDCTLTALDMCRVGQPQLQRKTSVPMSSAGFRSNEAHEAALQQRRVEFQKKMEGGRSKLPMTVASASVVTKMRSGVREASLD